MACCEKCWADAREMSERSGMDIPTCYHILLKERKNNPCSYEEQMGQFLERDLEKQKKEKK